MRERSQEYPPPLSSGGGNAPKADKPDMAVLRQLVNTTRNASTEPSPSIRPACCATPIAISTLNPAVRSISRINISPQSSASTPFPGAMAARSSDQNGGAPVITGGGNAPTQFKAPPGSVATATGGLVFDTIMPSSLLPTFGAQPLPREQLTAYTPEEIAAYYALHLKVGFPQPSAIAAVNQIRENREQGIFNAVGGQRTIQFVMGPSPLFGGSVKAVPAQGAQQPQIAATPIHAQRPVKGSLPTPAELDAEAARAAKHCSSAPRHPPAVPGRGGGDAPLASAVTLLPAQERGRPKGLTGLRARSDSERSKRARSSSRQSHARSRSRSQSRFRDFRSGEPFDDRDHTINTILAYVCRHGALELHMTVSNSGWRRIAEVIDFVKRRVASIDRNADYVTLGKVVEFITYAE